MHGYKLSRYAMAVLLICSSIAMAAYQVATIYTVAHGLLLYIAQAFLLAGSIFGLDYYVHTLSKYVTGTKNVTGKENTTGNPKQ